MIWHDRCSATPVRLTPESPLRFLAAGHAVLPWAFPGYFGESKAWLKFLNQTNVRYYAELREVRFAPPSLVCMVLTRTDDLLRYTRYQ